MGTTVDGQLYPIRDEAIDRITKALAADPEAVRVDEGMKQRAGAYCGGTLTVIAATEAKDED